MTASADSLIRRGWALVMARYSLRKQKHPSASLQAAEDWENLISRLVTVVDAVNVGKLSITLA